jgi:hypothetical protein
VKPKYVSMIVTIMEDVLMENVNVKQVLLAFHVKQKNVLVTVITMVNVLMDLVFVIKVLPE